MSNKPSPYIYTIYTKETMPSHIKCYSCLDSIKDGSDEMLYWSFRHKDSSEELGVDRTCLECYASKFNILEDIKGDLDSRTFLNKLRVFKCPTCKELYVDLKGRVQECSLCS